MFAVLRKDLSSQFLPLSAGIFATFGLLALLLIERITTGQAVLAGLRLFVVLGLAPLAWLIVNRLFVQDGATNGARFLERLPIGRGRVHLLRFSVGALLLVGVFGAALGVIVTGAAAIQRDLPPAQIDYIARQSLGFLAVIYTALVASAALGRHRHAVNAAVLGGLLLAWKTGADPVGPLAYPWEDFQTARGDTLPASLIVAGALLLGGLLLHRSRWGRRWQRPGNVQDAVAVGAVSAAILLASSLASSPVPFVLDGPVAEASGANGPVVQIRQAPGAGSLAADVASDLAQLNEEQGLELPNVALDLSEALEPDAFERADIGQRSGLLVRAPFTHPGTSRARLRRRLLREAFDVASEGRLRHGAWALLLAGYPRLLVPAGPELREQEELRVAWALRTLRAQGIEPADAALRWPEVRARLGDSVAGSLAGWLLACLAEATSPRDVHDLVREAQAEGASIGGGWGDGTATLTRLLAPHRAGGDPILAARSRDLLARHAAAIAALPAGKDVEGVEVALLPDGALRFAPGTGGGRVALLHALTRLDTRSVPGRFDREEVPSGAGPVETTQRYPSGARVAWALARYVPELGCDVLLRPWRTVEAP